MIKLSRKLVTVMMVMVIAAGSAAGCRSQEESFDHIPLKAQKNEVVSFKNVSVHDPSVVKFDGTYYVFGSHLAGAKSDDLLNWTLIGSGVTSMRCACIRYSLTKRAGQ